MPFSISTFCCVGYALVVYVERTAAAADGAVVDDRAQGARHLLAHAAGEGGHALAVEIGLEAVAYRFVQQDAGPARSENDGRFAGRRLDGIQQDHGLAGRFRGEVLGRLLFEELEANAPSTSRISALRGPLSFACERTNAHARHRLAVELRPAFAGGDQHMPNVSP